MDHLIQQVTSLNEYRQLSDESEGYLIATVQTFKSAWGHETGRRVCVHIRSQDKRFGAEFDSSAMYPSIM